MRYQILLLLMVTVILLPLSSQSSGSPKNHELLTKLGLTRLRTPNSHHRKRLAVESRHHSRSDDSHMFIIKLPPNPHYYNQPNSVHLPSNIPMVGFKSNGKPAKVYHWNIPTIKKMVNAKMKSRTDHPYDPARWNEVLDKPDKNLEEMKPLKPSFYVPNNRGSFMKFFPGNGKPHAFYVIGKSKKAHYHRLLP